MNPQTGRQQKENFTKAKWKNYDFTMFWSRISASHGIAVKWYLRVYWLLPLSIVDSFAEHRRLFCRAPMNTWAIQSTSFPQGVFSLFQQTLFLFINWNCRQLGRSHIESTDTVYKTLQSFCWQNGHAKDIGPKCFVGPCQDMRLRYWMTDINETKSLPCLVPYKKGNDSRIYSTCHFPSHLSIYWPLLFLFRDFVIPHTHHPGLHKGRSGWWDRWMKEVTSSETLPY